MIRITSDGYLQGGSRNRALVLAVFGWIEGIITSLGIVRATTSAFTIVKASDRPVTIVTATDGPAT